MCCQAGKEELKETLPATTPATVTIICVRNFEDDLSLLLLEGGARYVSLELCTTAYLRVKCLGTFCRKVPEL